MVKKGFPKTLYVYREDEEDETYFIAHDKIDVLPDEKLHLGIYKFSEAKNLKVTKELE